MPPINSETNPPPPITQKLQLKRLQLWGSKWSSSDSISHKTILHIPNIKNSEFKLKKKIQAFPSPFYFSFIFLDKTSEKFWGQSPSPHDQCSLQVSETVSRHKLCCRYSAKMLQHWVGATGLIYFCKVDHCRIFLNSTRIWLDLNNLCETLPQNLWKWGKKNWQSFVFPAIFKKHSSHM